VRSVEQTRKIKRAFLQKKNKTTTTTAKSAPTIITLSFLQNSCNKLNLDGLSEKLEISSKRL
jgi:hypothetical protein